jgi:hypothetical protein
VNDPAAAPRRTAPAATTGTGVRYREHVMNRTAAATPKTRKTALRAGAIAAGTTFAMVISSPAFAMIKDDGDQPGAGLSVAETLGLFVLLPVAIFAVITGAVMVLSKK